MRDFRISPDQARQGQCRVTATVPGGHLLSCFPAAAGRHTATDVVCHGDRLFAGFEPKLGVENAPAGFKVLECIAAPAALRQIYA